MKRSCGFLVLMCLGGLIVSPVRSDVEDITPTETSTPKPAAPKPAAPKKYRKPKKAKAVPKKASVTKVKPAAESSPEAASGKNSLQVWLTRMKKKVAHAQTKNNKLVAVASVRGAEASDAPPLYWKGKSAEGPVALPELKEFDDAITTAIDGDNVEARNKMENFILSHPKSPLVGEARETLDMLTPKAPPDTTP